jgi:hypothetical protein
LTAKENQIAVVVCLELSHLGHKIRNAIDHDGAAGVNGMDVCIGGDVPFTAAATTKGLFPHTKGIIGAKIRAMPRRMGLSREMHCRSVMR